MATTHTTSIMDTQHVQDWHYLPQNDTHHELYLSMVATTDTINAISIIDTTSIMYFMSTTNTISIMKTTFNTTQARNVSTLNTIPTVCVVDSKRSIYWRERTLTDWLFTRWSSTWRRWCRPNPTTLPVPIRSVTLVTITSPSSTMTVAKTTRWTPSG